MNIHKFGWFLVSIFIGVGLGLFFYTQYYSLAEGEGPDLSGVLVKPVNQISTQATIALALNATDEHVLPLSEVAVSHIKTPESVRGLYMSSWVMGTKSARDRVIEAAESGDINALVIDIKDATGKLSYTGTDPLIEKYGSYSNRVKDIQDIIKDLHKKGFYVIGRVSVFQDPVAAEYDIDSAVQNPDGTLWQDRNRLTWVDPSSEKHWQYITAIARESYRLGFDEINLDYVRFPTDGKSSDMTFMISGQKPDKSAIITKFFQYMDAEIRQKSGIPMSADVFGLTTTVPDTNDVGIGQNWIALLPYVDALCPMIYPSHYANGSFGYKNPAEYPYEIITKALEGAIAKNKTAGQPLSKIRPWIQDFDMGAKYEVDKVKAQIRAGNDLGITSYLSWDPANRYTPGAYEKIQQKSETPIVEKE